AVEGGRLMALIDDSDRGQDHAAADVEPRLYEKIDVRLFECDFALLLAAFDQCVLDFELAPELDSIRKTMSEQKHEAMKIRFARLTFVLVEMRLHIAGDREACFGVRVSLIIAVLIIAG